MVVPPLDKGKLRCLMGARLTHGGTAKLEIRVYPLGAGVYRLGAAQFN
jgi:hypothetical protein